MLTHINIKNFTIIDQLELSLPVNMAVITGETGAGKSVIVDAIELALGKRASSDIVRHGCDRADISVQFDISRIPAAQQCLTNYELSAGDECLIRRVITKDGSSKNYINGVPTTLKQLRELRESLINIHGQHEFHNLLSAETQRQLLDNFANHGALVAQLNQCYQQWRIKQNEFDFLNEAAKQSTARVEFLTYQIKELDKLNLTPDVLESLNQEHKQLANADKLTAHFETALGALSDQEKNNVISWLRYARNALQSVANVNEKINDVIALIDNSIIQTEEAAAELRHHLRAIENDPQRFLQLEQQLAKIHDQATRHRIPAAQLPQFYQQMKDELAQLVNSDSKLNELQQEIKKLAQQYLSLAQQLTASRKKTAKKLEQLVTENMWQLGMREGKFEIELATQTYEVPLLNGLEKINFLVNLNPGQALQPLNKVASGGELSRISLAIQVITAQNTATPTLVFDEVDVGIGGATAEIVGKLLRELGSSAQVICITHLPQVAAKGHHHLLVEKIIDNKLTRATISLLNNQQRITEIARMLGGINITSETLAHAKQMCEL